MTMPRQVSPARFRRLCLVLATATVIGCGQRASPAPPAGAGSPAPATASAPLPVCIEQAIWEGHEGAFTSHWEAADSALDSLNGAEGTAEARLAASELREMADLAEGPNLVVAGHLQDAADAIEEAATAFANDAFTLAKTRLSEALSKHELALGSTSAGDWC